MLQNCNAMYQKMSNVILLQSALYLEDSQQCKQINKGIKERKAGEDLDTFLGDQSAAFVAWLWDCLAENIHTHTQTRAHTHTRMYTVSS